MVDKKYEVEMLERTGVLGDSRVHEHAAPLVVMLVSGYSSLRRQGIFKSSPLREEKNKRRKITVLSLD